MPDLTQQELIEKYKKLPKDLQDAIFSVDTARIIIKTGEKYKLLIDKVGELGNETGRVLLGLTHPNNFVPNLEKRLGIDRQTARNVAEDVNKEIFSKVRENLKKIHGIHEETEREREEMESRVKTESKAEPEIKIGAPEIAKPPLPPVTKPELPPEKENLPAAKQPEVPPIFAPKTEEKIFTVPPGFSEKNQLLEELNKSLGEKKSIVQKLAEDKNMKSENPTKNYKDYDPYKEIIE